MGIKPIDDMPHLKARLGKARADRIRYLDRQNTRPQANATNLVNSVRKPMQARTPQDHPCDVASLLEGVARLDTCQNKPLSVQRLYNIFQCMEVINTREIQAMMALDQRQAQRYLRAAKLVLPYLERVLLPDH